MFSLSTKFIYKKHIKYIKIKSFSLKSCSHEEVRRQCRKFAIQELQPVAAEFDRNRTYPKEQVAKLGKLGLMGITVPARYGGAELDMQSTSIAVEELSRSCASTGAIVSIHNILYADLLATYGSDIQKDQFLKPYTEGIPGAFALSESEAGSDVANISTTAVKKGDYFILNGIKSWVTSAYQAEVAIVFATVDKCLERRGITAFLVPLNKSGVSLSEPDPKMGIKATSTCQVNLCDVSIPNGNIIGEVGGGFKIAMKQLNKARIGIASQALGIAQASLDTALDYAVIRCAFQKRLIDMNSVQTRLARMAAQIAAARLLVRDASEHSDKTSNIVKRSAIAKLVASEAATFSAHQCIQILGGMGYTEYMPAERFYRDARITEIYGGVTDIQTSIIAEQLLKEHEGVK